jgi:hypothetical protein
VVDCQCKVGKVWLAEDGGNDRRQDVGYERLYKRRERSADHNRDREVDHVASHYEVSEALQHFRTPSQEAKDQA